MKKFNVSLFVVLLAIVSYSTAFSQYQIGSSVEELSLTNYNGKEIQLEDFSAQNGIVVVFTSFKCKEAKAYLPRLQAIHKKYAPQGFPVLAIDISTSETDNEDDPNEAIVKMVEANKIDYLYGTDSEREVFNQFFGDDRKQNVPYAFVLSKVNTEEGEESFQVAYMGAIDDSPIPAKVKQSYLEKAVAKNVSLVGKRKRIVSDDEGDASDKPNKKVKAQVPSSTSYTKVTKMTGGCSSAKL